MASPELKEIAIAESRDELTDYSVYSRLARFDRNGKTKEVFSKLSQMEKGHFDFWSKFIDGEKIKPRSTKLYFVIFLRYIMGAAFAIKWLEGQESKTIKKYESYRSLIPEEDKATFEKIIADEREHELFFASSVESSYVKYISFIVLGLADALVEIAGIHAGSLGIYHSTELTGLAGIVAGAAASIAMASAAYAQAKHGFQGSSTLAAAYTGISYFVSAVILALPYFLTKSMFSAIVISLIFGIFIIGFVSWYNSVISDGNFRKDFGELSGIMLGASLALYIFGQIVRTFLGITI
ncbi:MAG: VIT1/CCC1 family protein [Conexivisphaerales archaeon]